MENDKTIKDQLEELDRKIEWFSGEDFNIDEAPAKYKEAKELADFLSESLLNIENEIEVIRES